VFGHRDLKGLQKIGYCESGKRHEGREEEEEEEGVENIGSGPERRGMAGGWRGENSPDWEIVTPKIRATATIRPMLLITMLLIIMLLIQPVLSL
jgi:hypothetical protein